MELNDYLELPYTITLRRDEDGDWIARVQELKGCTADGATREEALADLDQAKREWLAAALEDGIPIPAPEEPDALPSGKWVQRVPRSLHKNLARLAKVEGVSLNQLVTTILVAHVGINGRAGADPWRDADTAAWTPEAGPVSGETLFYLRALTSGFPDQADLREVIEEPKERHAHAGRR